MSTLIDVASVVVAYGKTTALAGASMQLAEGESLALVGPSGAGKSTLLRCMAALVRPSEGRVTYRGQDLGALGVDARAELRLHDFGFVLQGGELMPELTLAENVELPLLLAGARRVEARRRAAGLLEMLGVGREAGRMPHEVSGGQAQRAAVARAVVHGPSVVFADEPTGALDEANGAAVMATLRAAASAAGSALVMVTHDAGLAAQLDRVLEVHDGRVVPEKTHAETVHG